MTRRKIANREELLKYKVGVRFDEKTYNKLKTWVEQTNASSVGELVRKIITKEKVTFYVREISMEEPTAVDQDQKRNQCDWREHKSIDPGTPN